MPRLKVWDQSTGTWKYSGGVDPVALANDPAFTGKYAQIPAVAWTPYSPSWSGTIGNGVLSGAYHRIGRTIHWRTSLTWGTTTSHPATFQTLSLPFAVAAGLGTAAGVGQSTCLQTGVEEWIGSALLTSSTSVVAFIAGTSQVTGTAGRVTNLVPFTWANSHLLIALGMYEAAV